MNLLLIAMLFQDPQAERPTEKLKPPEKEIMIVPQRRESDILDVPSAVTVITADQISKSGATDIVQLLQKTPGFFAQGGNFGAYDKIVDLRGYNNGSGNGQRTLVLVDGRKTNSVSSSSTDWASIPIGNIERIEIVRGPAAALYGDGALAGVIDIITRKGGKDAWSGGSTAAGNWGSRRASANVGGVADTLLYDIHADIESTEGWRENSDYRGNNVTGRFEAPLNDSLRGFVKMGHHDDQRKRPGTLSKAEIEAFGRDGSATTGDESENEGNYVDAGLTQSLGSLGELILFTNFTRSASDSLFAAFGGFEIRDESDIAICQLKHIVTPRIFGRKAVFTTGLDVSYEVADAESGSVGAIPDESEYHRRLIGVYEHVELRPFDLLILSGSLRYDRALLDLDRDISPAGFGDNIDDQRAFDQLSPHLGATVRIVEGLSAYLSWGRTFKYPTRDELVGFLTSDPRLDPERARTYEIGTRFQSGTLASAGVTFYHMVVEDEIFFDPTVGFFGSNFNFEEVTHDGMEIEGRVMPLEWLEAFVAYSLTDTEITESANPAQEGKSYPVTPRYSGTLGATVKHSGAALTLSGRYVGSRMLINDFSNTQSELPDVTVYDAKLSYTWKFLTAFISVYNLTDREYFESGGLSFSGDRYSPAPEQSWLVGGDVRF
jgi:iron complex outermembrane receptor protein